MSGGHGAAGLGGAGEEGADGALLGLRLGFFLLLALLLACVHVQGGGGEHEWRENEWSASCRFGLMLHRTGHGHVAAVLMTESSLRACCARQYGLQRKR